MEIVAFLKRKESAMEEKEMREMLEDLTFKVNELYYGQIGVDEHLKSMSSDIYRIKGTLDIQPIRISQRQELDLRQLTLL